MNVQGLTYRTSGFSLSVLKCLWCPFARAWLAFCTHLICMLYKEALSTVARGHL